MTHSECQALVPGDMIAVPELGIIRVTSNDVDAKKIKYRVVELLTDRALPGWSSR